jgi:hypothetical protein
VGEAILLGEILIGIDLDGDEPGDDSKCILVVYGVGSCCVYTHHGRCRPGSVFSGVVSWFFRDR